MENADSSVRVYSRDQHNISRKNIHPNALKVLNRLNEFGYEAYLVGGCVRDLLLDQTPKDFDIATNATPEQVQKAFRNCRLVGRRFRLAHILFGREIIEVATFRGEHDKDEKNRALSSSNESGMLLRDNIYGTIEQDALRRDFTINSLYYDIKDFTIRDYCNGMSDLKKGIIRLIGYPETRYREDPVRILRAIRFKAKLGMTIEPKTEEPILALVPLLKNIPNPRLFDESLKLLQTGYGSQVYPLLEQYQVLPYLFPSLVEVSRTNQHTKHPTYAQQMITLSLKNTDERIKNDLRVNPAFLFAAMLWYPLIEKTESFINESSLPYHDAFNLAISEMLSEQCRVTSIPKRITTVIVDIWQLQLRLTRLTPKRIESTFAHNKFRAGYDLLVLRAQIENNQLVELATWWEKYQQSGIDNRIELVKNSPTQKKDGPTGKKKRNYRRPRKPKSRPKSE